ncbi:MAG: hypothetical protein ABJP70_10240 [Erythrobacter sp.]
MKKLTVLGLAASLTLVACTDTGAGAEAGDSSADATTTSEEDEVKAADEAEADAEAAKEEAEAGGEENKDQASADGPVARPVWYGESPGLDACSGVGEVSGLKDGGDGFLSVRAEPNSKSYESDRLNMGQQVFFCDATDDQAWIGIVYDKSGEKDCGTGSPIPEHTTYVGPCDSGWVSRKFVTLIAG